MIKIVVAGAKGRMGSMVAALAKNCGDMELVAGIDKGDSLEKEIGRADVVIDFTVAEAAAANALIAARHKKAVVIGTTGLSDSQMDVVKKAAGIVPVIMSPNMSVGVNILFRLVETASKVLGKQYKIDIVETHHTHKLDRPSGTAKKILDIVLEKTGRSMDKDVFFYDEKTDDSMGADVDVSVRSIRRGEVVGDHVIHFTNPGEILSIEHHASTREIFAEGAIVAARWILGKPAGLYGMSDVLGLRE